MVTVIKPSQLGPLNISPTAQILIEDGGDSIGELLERHRKGNYGNITPEIMAMNESSLIDREGVVTSIYEYETEAVIIRSYLSPFKTESFTEIVTGWEIA